MTGLRRRAGVTFSSLAIPNYRRWFVGQTVSQSGTWMQALAQGWLVLTLTGSATWLGVVVALQFVPTLLLGPYGGLLVDRHDTRRVLAVTQLALAAQAVALGLLVLTGQVVLWMVLALALVQGLLQVVEQPARQALVRELVPPDAVRNAVGLNSVVMNASRAVGPAVGGVLIAVVGVGICFLLNAVSYVVVLVALLRMDRSAMSPSPVQVRAPGQLREGFAYVRRTPVVLSVLVMMALVGMLTYEFAVTLPALVRTTFASGPATLGWLSAAMGAGAVVAGLWSAARRTTGLHQFAAAAVAFGLAVLGVAVAPTVPLAAVGMVAVGAASVAFASTGNSTLQLTAAPHMRGRVMALWGMAVFGTTPIGGPLVGLVAEHLGPRWALGLGSVAALAAAGLGALAVARIRERRPEIAVVVRA
ncbi:MAG: MFS transporter [Candidatus Nanopelagicales bacterium]